MALSREQATRTLDLSDEAATAALAARLAGLLRRGDAVLLSGPIGAGKSTLARAMLRSATGDSALDVPSPTFTLLQSYATRAGTMHHFDLWRLDGPEALVELGWEESLRDIVLVEWPERLGRLSPAHALRIALEPRADETRRAVLSGWPDRLARLTDPA